LDWVIGPIPVEDKIGKEIISRFTTTIDSGDEFYTDSNGRETIRRKLNYRPTYNLSNAEPESGNYYPVNTRIQIQNSAGDERFIVMTDRSQGGSSLASGQLELMLHRRCLHDDAFGVDEPLNETGYDGKGLQIRGTHQLMFLNNSESSDYRVASLQMALRPIIAFTDKPVKLTQKLLNAGAISDNVQLLSLEQLSANLFLIRLENIYEKSEDNRSATIDLQELFQRKITNMRETLLAANTDKSATRKFWNYKITLMPMQIRTFLVDLA